MAEGGRIETAGLNRIRWVFYKEFSSFFGSNIAPLAMGLTAFLCGLISVVLSLSAQGATYENVTRFLFYVFYWIIMIAALFLSMSSFVSEKKQGTMELLYTLPVTDFELTMGKFLMGAATLSFLATLMTLIYIVGIAEAPWHMAVAGMFGLFLAGFYAYSVGLFASSLTESYLLTLLISVAILVVIDVGGFFSGLLPSPAREIFSHFHGYNQYTPFTRGRIPLKGSIFFLSLTVFFIFLCVRSLESRRWRA